MNLTSPPNATVLKKRPFSNETFLGSGIKWNALVWSLLVIGILLRLFHFLDNRSLWIDESYLAASLIRMNFVELAQPPLDYEQKAPIGFLWTVGFIMLLFGKGEMALRLFPLLCGIGSLFVFMPVARYFLKPLGIVVAMGILALAPPLIFHAVEIKQYSSELLATVLALYLFTRYHQKLDYPSLLLWGIGGAVLLWFSYSVIFILAGIAIAGSLYYLVKKEWLALFRSILPFSMWAISFGINFFLFTYKHADSEWLTSWFRLREGFMPFPPSSLAELKWFLMSLNRMLDYPLGLLWNFGTTGVTALQTSLKLVMSLVALVCLGLGMLSFYRQDKKLFLVFIFPILLTLFASGLELYPFYERLLVFLAPLFAFFIARGCVKIVDGFNTSLPFKYLLPLLLLAWPLWSSATQVARPELFGGKKNATDREAYYYMKENFQEGDIVYIYWNVMHSYNYYKNAYGLSYPAVIEGSDVRLASTDLQDYYSRLKPEFDAVAKKKRVWYMHHKRLKLNIGDFDGEPAWYHTQEVEAGDLFQAKFGSMGKAVDMFETSDIRVTLFELEKAE